MNTSKASSFRISIMTKSTLLLRHLFSLATMRLGSCCLALVSALASTPAMAGEHVHNMAGQLDTKVSEANYVVPGLTMTRQDGTKVSLSKALDDGRPVILNFIYTSCTAICPITSQVFSDLRERLGAQSKAVNMVSISIDPDYDTPSRLKTYAARFDADANWSFYTGSLQDSIAIQKAFATYRGDKMNHAAVTYMRASSGKPWVRVEGFASPSTLLSEFKKLTGKAS